MKKLLYNLTLIGFCLLWTDPILADDDVLITRDGSMMNVKIEKISSTQVTFFDVKHKKRGKQNAPTDFVYMIMKEKGNNIFFDEEGSQTTSPAVMIGKKDNVMFLNRGEMFVVYNVSVGKDEVTYQLKDKKKEPFMKIQKSEVFMMRNSDGTTILYNNSYQEKLSQQRQTMAVPISSQSSMSLSPAVQSTSSQLPTTAPARNLIATPNTPQTTTASNQQLLAENSTIVFKPAPDMSAADIETAVNTKNPYTLYRKGSMAEYCFQYKGEKTQLEGGPTYVQQIVSDEKIENGLLVAYISQAFFNKKHEPTKGIPASFKNAYFPVEIDTAGTYHWTHNLLYDIFLINSRKGYGAIIPGDINHNMQLSTGTLSDKIRHPLFGGNFSVETTYTNWYALTNDTITVPAGTFNCIKLTGNIEQQKGKGTFNRKQNVTCWLARGIGVVQYETVDASSKTQVPFVVYLNKLDLK